MLLSVIVSHNFVYKIVANVSIYSLHVENMATSICIISVHCKDTFNIFSEAQAYMDYVVCKFNNHSDFFNNYEDGIVLSIIHHMPLMSIINISGSCLNIIPIK